MAYSPRIMRGIMNYQPLFEERMQLLMGHSTSRSRTPPALGLQLLVVGDDYFKEQFAKEELVWLRWYHFPHGKLPSWLSTGKLRVLELYDPERLTELWGPNDSPPSELRELIIKRCNLEMIPQTIGSLKLLKKIVLSSDYFDGAMISSLPEEFCRLESLEHLELTQFSHLSSLPGHFGDLKKLKHLNLYGSKTLTALPMSFNQLTELQYLDLSRCENFQLQEGILESITKLENLRLKGCSKLRELPADIDRLAKLEVLEIESHCLTSLPTALGNLSSLINLKIDSCVKLKNLPSLENLSSLIELTISNCRELTHLPGVGSLTRLEKLRLDDLGVKYLPQGFGQPVNLQTLTIMWCPIRELPLANHMDSSMSKFPRLKDIYLNFTEASTISISEDCCPSLKYLSISNGDDLMEIETLPTTLMRLNIHRCGKLKNIRCVAGLAKLQDLKIFYCAGLEKLPSFAGLVELRNCGIKNCPQLDELPSFACCTCLQELEIEGSNRITKIEGLEELRSLERLRLETYGKWQGIKSLKNLDILAMEISADSRSAIKRFVLPIPKGPRKMHILGKAGAVAVEDVESVVGSLRFSNFTVVYELLNELQHSGDIIRATWQLKSPQSNPSCLIGCFLIPPSPPSCSEDEDVRQLWPVGSSYLFFFNSLHFRGEGKQVYIWVLMERREGDDLMRAFLELQRYGVEMEKGMVVIMSEWEEGRVSEVLHKFMELLEP